LKANGYDVYRSVSAEKGKEGKLNTVSINQLVNSYVDGKSKPDSRKGIVAQDGKRNINNQTKGLPLSIKKISNIVEKMG